MTKGVDETTAAVGGRNFNGEGKIGRPKRRISWSRSIFRGVLIENFDESAPMQAGYENVVAFSNVAPTRLRRENNHRKRCRGCN